MGSQRARARETEREPIKKFVFWGRGRLAHFVMEDVFEVLVFVSRCEAKEKNNHVPRKTEAITFYAGDIDQHSGLSISMSSVYWKSKEVSVVGPSG